MSLWHASPTLADEYTVICCYRNHVTDPDIVKTVRQSNRQLYCDTIRYVTVSHMNFFFVSWLLWYCHNLDNVTWQNTRNSSYLKTHKKHYCSLLVLIKTQGLQQPDSLFRRNNNTSFVFFKLICLDDIIFSAPLNNK